MNKANYQHPFPVATQWKPFLLFVCLFACTVPQSVGQTTIFSNAGKSYGDVSGVPQEDRYSVSISSCASIEFTMDFMFALDWEGSGNMEASDECIGGCSENPANPTQGGCSPCWDFLWVRLFVDGVMRGEELVGVAGETRQSGNIFFDYTCNGTPASTAEIVIVSQTWASNEGVTFNNLKMVCNQAVAPFLDPIDPLCVEDAPIGLPASQDGFTGTWSGPGVSGFSFNPTDAGQGTHVLTFTPNPGQCVPPATTNVQVTPANVVNLSPLGPFCVSDEAILLDSDQGGILGTWSGTGISQDIFDPAIAGTGSHSLTFTPDPGQCATARSINVSVSPNETYTLTTPGPFCSSQPAQALATTQDGKLGVWSGVGVSGNTFNPATAGMGSHTLTFTPNPGQCAQATTVTVTVNTGIPITLAPIGPFCSDAPATALDPMPNGIIGAWSGAGVSGNTFTPSAAGQGTHTLTFTPNPGQCATAQSISVVVSPNTTYTLTTPGPYCISESAQALTTTQGGVSGSWSGIGVTGNTFNPATAGAGSHPLTFTPNAGQCAAVQSTNVVVTPTTIFTPTTPGPYCISQPAQALASNQSGVLGSWSGIGVSGNTFNPATAGVGSHTLTFTPNPGQCAQAATVTVTVNTGTTITLAPIGPFCSDAPATALDPMPNGINGAWSGAGVSGNTFTPSAAGQGTHTLTFTPNPGQCATASTLTVNVRTNAPVVLTTIDPVCASVSGQGGVRLNTVQSGITGVWSGAGVINGDSLDVSTGGTGDRTLTFTPNAGQCGLPNTLVVTVRPQPTVQVFAPAGIVCAGSEAQVQYTGTPGAIFNWTNDNTRIGLASLGTGNILPFQPINSGIEPDTATITVIPELNGCPGVPTSFIIQVDPLPVITPVRDTMLCAGDTLSLTFTGSTNTAFSWLNNNPATGIQPTGNDSLRVRLTALPTLDSSIIILRPVRGTCVGKPDTFSITLLPFPQVEVPKSDTLCPGETSIVVLRGTPNAIISWRNDNTGIGLAPSGTGTFTFTSANTSATQTARISLSIRGQNGCVGRDTFFTVTLYPKPDTEIKTALSFCEGDTLVIPISAQPTGSSVQWMNDNVALGIPSSGIDTVKGIAQAGNSTIRYQATYRGCISDARQFTISVDAQPMPPGGTTTYTFCQNETPPANPFQITGTQLRWYTSPSGGTGQSTEPAIVTSQPGTIFRYVSQTINGCESPRTAVQIRVLDLPTAIISGNTSICSGDQATLIVTGTPLATVRYTKRVIDNGMPIDSPGSVVLNAQGEARLTDNVAAIYLLNEVQLGNCIQSLAVQAEIRLTTRPEATLSGDVVVCSPATTGLVQIQGTPGAVVRLSNGDSTTLPGSGVASLALPNGNYTLAGIRLGSGTCTGTVQGTARVVVKTTPTATITGGGDFCAPLTTGLVTISGTPGAIVYLSDGPDSVQIEPDGSNALQLGAGVYTIDSVGGSGFCRASGSGNVQVRINQIPQAPTVSSPLALCQAATPPVLMATGQNLLWYADSLGGVGTANPPAVSTTVAGNRSYFVSQTVNGCESRRSRIEVQVTATPTITNINRTCAPDKQTYSIRFNRPVNVLVTSSAGVVRDTGVFDIPVLVTTINLTLRSTLNTQCEVVIPVTAPDCSCDPIAAPISGGDTSICIGQSIPALAASVGAGLTVDWYPLPVGGTPLLQNAPVLASPLPLLPAGVYTFYAEAKDTVTNCVSATRTPIRLTIIEKPVVNPVTDQAVCAGDSISTISFSGSAGSTIRWLSEEGLPGLAAQGQTSLRYAAPASIVNDTSTIIQVVATTGRCVSDTLSFSIRVTGGVFIRELPTECAADRLSYSVRVRSNANSLTSSRGQVSKQNDSTYLVQNIPADSSILLTGSKSNCSAVTQTINAPNCNCTVLPQPTRITQDTVCIGDTLAQVQVALATGLTANWYGDSLGGLPLAVNQVSYVLRPSGGFSTPANQILYVAVKDTVTGCENTQRIPVGVFVASPPVVLLSGIAPLCPGDEGSIRLQGNGNTGFPYQVVVNGLSQGSISSLPFTIPDLTANRYSIQVRNNVGCIKDTSIQIQARRPLLLDIGQDTSILLGDTLILSPVVNFTPVDARWTPPIGLGTPDSLRTNAFPLEATQYRLVLRDSSGCTISDEIRITIQTQETRIYFPTAFSPNGDGANDYFIGFSGQSIVKIDFLRIYDRWGEPVFVAENIDPNREDQGWNGIYRGQESPGGVYVFTARVSLTDGKEIPLSGEVLLVR